MSRLASEVLKEGSTRFRLGHRPNACFSMSTLRAIAGDDVFEPSVCRPSRPDLPEAFAQDVDKSVTAFPVRGVGSGEPHPPEGEDEEERERFSVA